MNSQQTKQTSLQELRALLKQRFPEAHPTPKGSATEVEAALQTGVPALDAAGLPASGLIELTGAASSGVSLAIWAVIRQRLLDGHAVAFVDSHNQADMAQAWPERLTARLLWVRCHTTGEAMQAMDLLVRDGNIRHLILDLQKSPHPRQPHTLPAPLWYRLRNVAETHGAWILIASHTPTVPCAMVRAELTHRFGLDALSTPRETLLQHLGVTIHHRRDHQSPPVKGALRQVG
jgi:hypothetical protein